MWKSSRRSWACWAVWRCSPIAAVSERCLIYSVFARPFGALLAMIWLPPLTPHAHIVRQHAECYLRLKDWAISLHR